MLNFNNQVVEGRIKWFDPVNGFGFITCDHTDQDILLHVNVLRNYGQSSVAEESEIKFAIQQTERGLQAINIVEISPPKGVAQEPQLKDVEAVAENLDAVALEPARVKFFDKAKGFGFANVFGRAEDVFIHVDVLRRAGLAEVFAGEALGVRVVDGQRGRMAAQVVAWDTALVS